MGLNQVIVVATYLGFMQLHLHQAAPTDEPTAIYQLRIPFFVMDGSDPSTYVVPNPASGNVDDPDSVDQMTYKPRAIKLSIPTSKGRANVYIDNLPSSDGPPSYYHNSCGSHIDKTNMNVIVKINKKTDSDDKSEEPTGAADAKSTVMKDKNGNEMIENMSETKGRYEDEDMTVDVTVDMDKTDAQFDPDNAGNSPGPGAAPAGEETPGAGAPEDAGTDAA